MHRPPSLIYWPMMFAEVLLLAYIVSRYIKTLQNRPRFDKKSIVFQEYFASGFSEKNILTRLGGANNCLRLVVTDKILWVTSWPPFSIITSFYDLEHVIPLRSITKIEYSRRFFKKFISVTYTDDLYSSHTLQLWPKHKDEFLRSLGVNPEQQNNNAQRI